MSAHNGSPGGSPHPLTPLDVARSYVARGWNPVPVPFKEKGPTDRGWHKRVITEENVHRYFDTRPQNVGVQMGRKSNGLADVDLDCEEAVSLAPHFLPHTPAEFGRAKQAEVAPPVQSRRRTGSSGDPTSRR
jgi:Bifunctional DNA primase/polymerase, N-terminal